MEQRTRDLFNRAMRQAPWRTQAQATSLVLSGVIVVVVIGTLYLAQASRTAAVGRSLQDLDEQRRLLEQQNDQLKAEIAALRSVPRLASAAQNLGYRPATAADMEYMQMPGERPQVQATATPFPNAAELVPAYNETLGSWLAGEFQTLTAGLSEFFSTNFGPEPTPTPTAQP
jgi:type VI protein secretion system component VasK